MAKGVTEAGGSLQGRRRSSESQRATRALSGAAFAPCAARPSPSA
jgi:hypothetical protein